LIETRLKEARSASDLAFTLCQQGQDRGRGFRLKLRAQTERSKPENRGRALKILEGVKTEFLRDGYTSYELESRLLMGKIELDSERITSGRSRLEALIKDAPK
jgi:hypothetical protein